MAARKDILASLSPGGSKKESASIVFTPPSTYSFPDEAADGRDFELMITGRMTDDGQIEVVKLGGIPLEEMEEEAEVETDEVDEEEAMTLQEAMAAENQAMGMA